MLSFKDFRSIDTLYVCRKLTDDSVKKLTDWSNFVGIENVDADLHVTIASSRVPVNWKLVRPMISELSVFSGSAEYSFGPLGDKGACVLKFKSEELEKRHEEFKVIGCSWDYDSYTPHVTLTYDGSGIDWRRVRENQFSEELTFGPEQFNPVREDLL